MKTIYKVYGSVSIIAMAQTILYYLYIIIETLLKNFFRIYTVVNLTYKRNTTSSKVDGYSAIAPFYRPNIRII